MSQTSLGWARPGAAAFAEASRPGGWRTPRLIAAAFLGLVSIAIALRDHPAVEGGETVEAGAPAPVVDRSPSVDPARPDWQEIASPEHIYALDLPGLPDLPRDYAARRHAAGGGREDLIALGAFDGTTPSVRLRMARRTGAAPTETPLYAALAHEAAQAGLSVDRSGLAEILPTRFGRFEIADVALVRADGGAPLACSGFRLDRDDPGLSIAGFACGARAAPLTRLQAGCFIERLDLAAVGNDRALADFFAAAERARNPACPGAEPPAAELLPDVASTGKPATGRRRLRRH